MWKKKCINRFVFQMSSLDKIWFHRQSKYILQEKVMVFKRVPYILICLNHVPNISQDWAD
jgi:hypothetical protein